MFRRRPRVPEVPVVAPRKWRWVVLGWIGRRLARLLWVVIRGLLGAGGVAALAAAAAFARGWTGRHRHVFRPVVLVATLWVPFPQVAGVWIPRPWLVYGALAAVLWIIYRTRGRIRGASEREVSVLATAASFLAVWHPVFTAVGGPARTPVAALLGAVYLAAMGYHAWVWIDGRRIRPVEPEQVDPLVEEWAHRVAPIPGITPVVPDDPDDPDGPGRYIPTEIPDAEGTFTEWTSTGEGEGHGVLRLARAKASEVATKDEDAERALDLRRGGVVLSNDPRLSVREVRVFIRKDPDAAARQLVTWQGPGLTKDRRFPWAVRRDGSIVYGRLSRPEVGSVIHKGMVAPSRGGKGGAFRIVLLEQACDPLSVDVNIDGKGGGGIPYAEPGASHHVTEPHLWLPTLRGFRAAMMVRSDRQRVAKVDGWVATPAFPQMNLNVDELPKVHAWGTRKQQGEAKFIVLDITRTGGSLGYGLNATLQKGDDGGWGDTETRMNVMGEAGQVWLGKVTDVGATNTAYQSLGRELGIDPARLPDGAGWSYIAGKGGDGQAVLEARTLWIPTRFDVDFKGHEAPFGTVEDWMEARAVRGQPDTLEWAAFMDTFDAARQEIESSAAVAPPAGIPVAVGAPAAAAPGVGGDGVPGGAITDPWAVPLGGGLATVTPIRTAPAPAPKMPAGRMKVLAALEEARENAEGRVSAREIARRTGLHVSTVTDHLNKLAADELADGGPDEGWSAA